MPASDTRCSAKQISDAVLIWSSLNGSNPVLCFEFEDAENLTCLGLFISTMVVFSDAFSNEMDHSYDEFLEQPTLSKRSFIEYLKPRVVSLAEKNECFDFMLVCAYVSRIIKSRALTHNCFHLAQVACELLNRILDAKFREIFETDCGWNNLISFCRQIHAEVFPSQKFRPLHYSESHEEVVLKMIEKIKKLKLDDDDKVSEQKKNKHNQKFLAKSVKSESSSDSSGIEDDFSDGNSIMDDITYWNYLHLDLSTICEKITSTESHLKDVYKHLKKLKADVDTESLSSNEYEISFDNDEYMEKLELSLVDTKKIVVRSSMKKKCAHRICEEENKLRISAGQDQVYPENIAYGQIREYIFDALARAKCELCHGKMPAFIEYCTKKFHKDYKKFTEVTSEVS